MRGLDSVLFCTCELLSESEVSGKGGNLSPEKILCFLRSERT